MLGNYAKRHMKPRNSRASYASSYSYDLEYIHHTVLASAVVLVRHLVHNRHIGAILVTLLGFLVPRFAGVLIV